MSTFSSGGASGSGGSATSAAAGLSPEPLVANPTTDDPLSLFLVQIVIILVLVRILAKLLGRLRQPPVIGEIIAGILLGPSAFGYIPGFTTTIFPTSSLTVISVFAQIGLIFFMFFLGLEVDVLLLTRNWRAAAPVAILSIVAPFAAGIGISYWFYDIEPTTATQTVFLLFMGTSFSFTAFPVLARILTSFRLLESGVGVHTLSIAAIDDVLAWCVLAVTLSYAGGGSAISGLYTMLLVIAFVLVVIFIARPFMVWAGLFFHQRKHSGDEFNRDYVAILFFLLACASIWTEIIGVHAFFGAFAFGVCVPKEYGLVEYLAPKIELLIVEFFLPLYFANSGLSTQLGTLNTGALWGKAVALIVIATVAKMGPVTVMTRLTSTCFHVNTVDPDESDPAALDDLAQKDADMEARGFHGALDVGEELEMVDMIAAQHAEITGTPGMKGVALEAVEEETKSRDDSRPNPPPALFVDTGGGDNITTDGGSRVDTSEERKDAEDAAGVHVVVGADDDLPDYTPQESPTRPAEATQLSRRSRSQAASDGGAGASDGTGVRFADEPMPSSNAGRVIAHPTLSGTSSMSGRQTPDSGAEAGEGEAPRPVPLPWITCLSIGVLMNTRGLVALIALNIGLQKGILGPRVFALMVLMALATTFITSPVFEWLFYKPYMAAKRQKREDRRREAELQRRLESGASLSKEEEAEEELMRTARQRKEEMEEAKAREEDLYRMTILVHQYAPTPRTPRVPMFPQTPHSAEANAYAEKPDSFRRAHTVGYYPSARGSISSALRTQGSLHSLYYQGGEADVPQTRADAFNLPQPETVAQVPRAQSHTALDRLGRGGGDSMHNLMQTGPSRFGLGQGGGAGGSPRHGRTIISSRHPSDTSHTAADLTMQTGPSRFHHQTGGQGGGGLTSKTPPPVVTPRGGGGQSLQESLLQTGPSRMHHMADIREGGAAEEEAEAKEDVRGGGGSLTP